MAEEGVHCDSNSFGRGLNFEATRAKIVSVLQKMLVGLTRGMSSNVSYSSTLKGQTR